MRWRFGTLRGRPSSPTSIRPSVIPAEAPSVVIPAKAGIHFDFVFWRLAIADSRPCVLRRPSLVAGYFLLLAQKKVTQEKGTLAAAVRRHPCLRTTRAGYGVCLGHLRVPCANARASVHAPLRAFPSPARRGREGPGKSKARQFLPQKRRIYATSPISAPHICGDTRLVIPAKAGIHLLCS